MEKFETKRCNTVFPLASADVSEDSESCRSGLNLSLGVSQAALPQHSARIFFFFFLLKF